MPAGRKRAREAGVQKRRERAKRQGKEGEISLLRHIHSCTEVKNHGIIANAIIIPYLLACDKDSRNNGEFRNRICTLIGLMACFGTCIFFLSMV